jgi:hypothetical protein
MDGVVEVQRKADLLFLRISFHGSFGSLLTSRARASAESYATEYFSSRGGVEEAAKHASEVLSESNPCPGATVRHQGPSFQPALVI